MFTCKQVSNSLEKQHYAELPWFKRIGLRLHVALCVVCGRYNKQVMLMQDTCHHFNEHCEKEGEPLEGTLDESSKAKMQEMIKVELDKS